jgi:hypothetical protein
MERGREGGREEEREGEREGQETGCGRDMHSVHNSRN